MSEKIQKVLAQAGIASRRTIERMIEEGRILVNGKLAKIGDRVTDAARISVDNKLIHITPTDEIPTRVLVYNKPAGEICSRDDPERRASVFDGLPKLPRSEGRWVMVGRLDINTEGLLLFTNNGELANQLMHPSFQIEREYLVRVLGEVTPEIIQQLLKGVKLEEGVGKFEKMKAVGGESDSANQFYRVVLTEGRNREVRRLFESQGLKVSRLKRIRYGKVELQKNHRRGQYIPLSSGEIEDLMS